MKAFICKRCGVEARTKKDLPPEGLLCLRCSLNSLKFKSYLIFGLLMIVVILYEAYKMGLLRIDSGP
jgi:hypothetical protein